MSATTAAQSIIYLGMDVHKDSITIAVLPQHSRTPSRVDKIPNDQHRLRRYLERLAPEGQVRACYEASGAGYVIQRWLKAWGHACDVIAPSLIPKKPGVQRKHDKRDAAELARLYRSGELTAIRIPSEAEERVRDVVRCRETIQREVVRSRHYILKFLARRGLYFRDGAHWKSPHLRWLQTLSGESSPLSPEDRLVFSEYWGLLQYKLSRRDELDRRIEELALLPHLSPVVGRLQCFRGISLLGAMVLATEIGDWRRFERPTQLSAYLGLIPKEDSSGNREHRGSITKAGNAHCRRILVEAAWHYHHRPYLSTAIRRRQVGQSAQVVAHAWKAQQRLHKRFNHLNYRKKRPQIAVVGVARELVGFLWAVLQDVEIPQVQPAMN